MANKNNYENEWRGAGWYTIREWIYTGDNHVEDWASPEPPSACWYETKDEFVEALTDDPERGDMVWYFGSGECPDDAIPIAPNHNIDYDIWSLLMRDFANLRYRRYLKSGAEFVPALYRLLAEYRDELTAKLR